MNAVFPLFCVSANLKTFEDSLDIMTLTPFYFSVLNDIIFYMKVGEKVALYIEDLRKLCTDDTIIMTAHVIKRCKERNIDSDSIIKVIMQGEIIKQYEDDKPFPSCLLLGMSINGKYLHVVVASDNINLHIITAYYPSIDEWEPDFKTRKGR